MKAEHMPLFPREEKGLMAFLQKNIKYSTITANNEIQGHLTLHFVVNKTECLLDVTVLK